MISKAPLEAWIAQKIGLSKDRFTRDELHSYQLRKLRETIGWARQHSSFYRELLGSLSETDLTTVADLQRFPFTEAEDIRSQSLRFLCVSQDDISRVVTLDSSGTTGSTKRLYFTEADQALTIDYFQYGMAAVVEKGDRVLILFPGERPGGLGDLLARAVRRLGVEPIPHGIVTNIPATLEIILREKVDSLVGIPTQVLALARYAEAAGIPIHIKSVLISSDYVPWAIARELKRIWGCAVFDHYGMTEMGLGGGTECAALNGCHLHEADLFLEIVDPQTGEVLPEGEEGEVVVTTLTRLGMPLIRYRTGDITRILAEPCLCGASLRRIAKITRRKNNSVILKEGRHFVMSDLDEALFSVNKIIDFTATVDDKSRVTILNIAALSADKPDKNTESMLSAALNTIPPIGQAREKGALTVSINVTGCDGSMMLRAAKRNIMELKQGDG